jgi:uncharacterized protein YbbK (DUF523 family)
MKKCLVSKCLTGELCRWDGKRLDNSIMERLKGYEIYPVCPEMEGGLPCPRPRAEIADGDGDYVLDGLARVKDDKGNDVTFSFLQGAQCVLNLALKHNIKKAFLKEKSPSCGVNVIYNNGRLVDGVGVTAALLIRHGVKVSIIE